MERADESLSFAKMTFAHKLMRLILEKSVDPSSFRSEIWIRVSKR